MDRNKKIIKNTVVFAIGNFGSKILSYVMVFVYTHYIGKSELGYYDLILTTVNLLHPLLLMAFDEGIYRWLIGSSDDKKTVISTCLKATGTTTFISIILFSIINIKFSFQYFGLIILFVATSMMYSMFQNAIRGLTKNTLYAVSGILNSIVILFAEIITLIFLSMGIEGLLISKILANIVVIWYIYAKESTLHGFFKTPFSEILAKKIFNYSVPLIPNQISWWIVNSSDRYIILGFLGTAFNGIYSISNKFPTIITTITGVIYFALQETIIKEYTAEDRDEFYSSTFKNYYVMLFSLICCAIPATKLIINWFVSPDFIEAWKFTGFLYLSTVFSALSSFLGIGYQISKETNRSVISTVSAAMINIAINIVFVKWIGLHAASLSTFIAYFGLFIIRIVHSKKYFLLNINWNYFVLLLTVSFAIIFISYYGNIVINIVLMIMAGLLSLYLNRDIIKTVLKRRKLRWV